MRFRARVMACSDERSFSAFTGISVRALSSSHRCRKDRMPEKVRAGTSMIRLASRRLILTRGTEASAYVYSCKQFMTFDIRTTSTSVMCSIQQVVALTFTSNMHYSHVKTTGEVCENEQLLSTRIRRWKPSGFHRNFIYGVLLCLSLLMYHWLTSLNLCQQDALPTLRENILHDLYWLFNIEAWPGISPTGIFATQSTKTVPVLSRNLQCLTFSNYALQRYMKTSEQKGLLLWLNKEMYRAVVCGHNISTLTII